VPAAALGTFATVVTFARYGEAKFNVVRDTKSARQFAPTNNTGVYYMRKDFSAWPPT
jgi:hypothetical protein